MFSLVKMVVNQLIFDVVGKPPYKKLNWMKMSAFTQTHHCFMSGNRRVFSFTIGKILERKTIAMIKNYSHLSTSSTASALDRMNDEIFGEWLNAT